MLWRQGVHLGATDKFGDSAAHKTTRGRHSRSTAVLKRAGSISTDLFHIPNLEGDSAVDFEADETRFWGDNGPDRESMRTLRDLAKLRREGRVSHSDFRRLRNRALR